MRRSWFSTPDHTWLWTDASWSHCERCIKEFEDAWRLEPRPSLTQYLRAEGPPRQALLVELIHVDLEFRFKAGESVRIETYLSVYPELAADRQAVLGLLMAECELRQGQADVVPWEEIGRRFPEYVHDLQQRYGPESRMEAPRVPVRSDADTPDGSGQITAELARELPRVPGYEILGPLGHGGMGVVYQARELNLGRFVALKFLPADYVRDPDRLERFRREARTTSALNHPHICTIHALGEHTERPFIVMELIQGRTLRELPLPCADMEEAARLIGQAARALAAAHAAGVVHRDIKPENIMVRADGYVKVLDFGLARRLPTLRPLNPGEAHDTDPGALLGTLAFMSPEQTCDAAVDSASDIFSLGIVFYQLVTGRHPFEEPTTVGMLHAIATRQQAPPSRLNAEVPPALERLIEAMLHKDPRLRLTADEVVAALTVFTSYAGDRLPTLASAPPRPQRLVLQRRELTALRATFDQAEAGRGAVLCLTGEPGIGKTTLEYVCKVI